ncbi:oxysterol-binding protein, putative [Entamoeba histolytica HM-1:IMSS-B]|uniref:Oxysterol binding protein, putative n=6 Tax=Entamoeba histolytica TaxID=5759 RepID=C4M300_ENTH1|nr:Oxysterol binding protein, putative [Entamoeba histolytica HM-1:IMSS]EMD46383.1 oxysterol -binding protein, putative [Entamoeba histolytica KU27]EMH75503.1 oxysterol-binding protein, putative [Entamoeba histolytica HM-1:IMSS-B]EMS11125.1 oxysterol binding protein [Entamoeba histolytica HM-3:IMSS]ENY60081.1 oxysterol binding protein, putative [Entamoeba histolytica HM-1:IMSS-A]GAT95674.1 oxysterol-binding protein putative [Entamoeba histolytica]|eukprot:XP_653552.1 Oxysterol binding protein, putative [Entamoeba histolytica HM-1:IMSS]
MTTPIRIDSDAIKQLHGTVYVQQEEKTQEFVDAMEKGDGKSIIWEILKQLRPGMSLERITMPTHVMEPRSLLEKLTDYFTHLDLVNAAANAPTAEERMVKLVQFFLSGFYITPKACKKPYNPLLGEFYRTSWSHADGSKTFFIAEQTSHHPPVSSIYACNRQAGWVGTGSLDFVTTFNGLSASAGIQGLIKAKFTKFDEDYEWNFPMALVTGIYIPPLTMEIGGVLNFVCKQSGYKAKVEFKTMSMFSSSNYRQINGIISDPEGKPIYEINGRYDEELFITDKRTKEKKSFFKVEELKKTKEQRLVREFDKLHPFESEKLFKRVSDAIIKNDQNLAMEEKFVLEEAQRTQRKLNDEKKVEQERRLFDKQGSDHDWKYKWENWNKYDPETEGEELEIGGKIVTLKKNEVLNEERIKEILSDIPYPDWKEGEEPPHMLESFKFLLDRYKKVEDNKDKEEENKEDNKETEEKKEEAPINENDSLCPKAVVAKA